MQRERDHNQSTPPQDSRHPFASVKDKAREVRRSPVHAWSGAVSATTLLVVTLSLALSSANCTAGDPSIYFDQRTRYPEELSAPPETPRKVWSAVTWILRAGDEEWRATVTLLLGVEPTEIDWGNVSKKGRNLTVNILVKGTAKAQQPTRRSHNYSLGRLPQDNYRFLIKLDGITFGWTPFEATNIVTKIKVETKTLTEEHVIVRNLTYGDTVHAETITITRTVLELAARTHTTTLTSTEREIESAISPQETRIDPESAMMILFFTASVLILVMSLRRDRSRRPSAEPWSLRRQQSNEENNRSRTGRWRK